MSQFKRDISIEVGDEDGGFITVRSRMVDVMHDIVVSIRLSFPQLVITDVEVVMVRVPQQQCRLIYPIAKQLVGTKVGRGFNRAVASVLAGGRGCPNVMNMILVSAPLAIHSSHDAQQDHDGVLAKDAHHGKRPDPLKGICIAHVD